MADSGEGFDAAAAAALTKALRTSFASGKTRSYEWRVSQLQSLMKMCVENENEILDALTKDLAKPTAESVLYEVGFLQNACSLALKELKKWMRPEKVKSTLALFPSSAEIVPEPLGVVLIIAPWNYPFILCFDPIVGAVAAGNTVVLKPSEIAPATSLLVAKLVAKYMDGSCIRVVEGSVAETSALLEQKWDKIFYTGSTNVGRIVMTAAAKHLTPVVLELGGKSPVVVDSNINFQVTARRIIAGKWGLNCGQACIAPDYVLCTEENASTLVDVLKNELERFFGQDMLASKDMSRIVNPRNFSRVAKLLDDEKVCDKIVYGGQMDKDSLRISPTILLDVPRDSLIMGEEIFGPLLPIVLVDTIDDCFEVISSGAKPLAAYLFSNDKKLQRRFVEEISAGAVVINDTAVHLSVLSLPFGGVGDSGMGSYHGRFSFDAFSHKKAVAYRSFIGDASMRYPPYTTRKLNLLKAVLRGHLWGILRAFFGL